jgi:type IX secretion system PorP/SprF family membrane protein
MRKFYTFIFVAIAAVSTAQDIHFSQFYNTPLFLNPALTGFMAGNYRVGVDYRNQWFTVTSGGFGKSPYMTTAASGDMAIKIRNNSLGIGLCLANDQAGSNTFSTVTVNASVSYILTLGKKQRQRLSVGAQAGYYSQSILSQNFQFANQFQDNVFNPNMASNEAITQTHVGYVTVNAGLMWYGRFGDNFGMYAGASAFNISMPKYDIIAGDSKKVYLRYNAHTGIDVILANKYHILPSLMYMLQGPDNQFNTGLGFGMDVTDDMALTIGVYNRFSTIPTSAGASPDAVIPYLAYDLKGAKLGISYDATISTLKTAGSAVGGFELSLVYTGRKKGDFTKRNKLLAPRF